MSRAASTQRLRLVGTEDEVSLARWRRARRDQVAVARENRSAARPRLDPTDARWILAIRAHARLEGSALTPENRQRVLETARRLGIRPFDANVIIALVQDQARRGETLDGVAPTLALVPRPRRRAPALFSWWRWLSALLSAAAATTLLIWWLRA